ELLAKAQQNAFNNNNPNIENAHILQAILDDEEGSIAYLLKKSNTNLSLLKTKLQDELSRLPKQGGGDPGQNISREANNAVLRASTVLKEFGDDFVTPEHMLLSILKGNDSISAILKDAGLTEK